MYSEYTHKQKNTEKKNTNTHTNKRQRIVDNVNINASIFVNNRKNVKDIE